MPKLPRMSFFAVGNRWRCRKLVPRSTPKRKMAKKFFRLTLLALGTAILLALAVSCCSLIFPKIDIGNDTAWEKRLGHYASFHLGDKVFIIGGYHSKFLYSVEKPGPILSFMPNSNVEYQYDHIASRKVYVSESPAMLQLSRMGKKVAFGESFQPVEGPPPDEVIRRPQYYVELKGAVYCVAGEAPDPPEGTMPAGREYNDVWKTEDGRQWTRILENGPWAEAPADAERRPTPPPASDLEAEIAQYYNGFKDHELFACDGRIWLTGGDKRGIKFKTVWSSPDGVHWKPEANLPEVERVTNIYSFRGEVFIRGELHSRDAYRREAAYWKMGGGVFSRAEGPWEDFDNHGRPSIFAWNDRLWCAFDCAMLVSDDGKNWRELFVAERDFNQAISVKDDSLCAVDEFSGKVHTSQDGIHWTEDGSRKYDYLPAVDCPFDREYSAHPAVLEYRNSLWVITGHPEQTWRSDDGFRWTQVRSLKGKGLIPRKEFSAAVFKDRIWVIGGVQTKENTYSRSSATMDLALNDAWSTQDGRVWRREADAPWCRRSFAKAVVHQGELYILGGSTPNPWGKEDRHYMDIWKTAAGRTWTKTGDYRDLWGDKFPIGTFDAIRFRSSLLLFDNDPTHSDNCITTLRLTSNGRWEKLPVSRCTAAYIDPSNVANSAVVQGAGGRERIFAWKYKKLYCSNDLSLNSWEQYSYRLSGKAEAVSANYNSRLVAFRGGLYLVVMEDSQPFSARIRLGK